MSYDKYYLDSLSTLALGISMRAQKKQYPKGSQDL
jgi:hypothetical protein